MDASIPGIHHITAIAGPAQESLDFYTTVLGLRCVKTTVNFDDPTTYHLYFGDATGRPGTILTLFPWAQAVRGRAGAGMATAVAFAVPSGSLPAWQDRLAAAAVETRPAERFGEPVLQLTAPDGLPLELVATDLAPSADAWAGADLDRDLAIRGFHGTTLPALDRPHTEALFTDVFGWTRTHATDDRIRVVAPDRPLGGTVDLQTDASHAAGRMGQGTVHHVAFRARDADEQRAWQAALRDRGLSVTDVKDRQYFQSIYFRDPEWTSGVLFEIATDGPGFTADESADALGTALQLPPWLEERRSELEAALPTLER
jgi:glyoxalase family protein